MAPRGHGQMFYSNWHNLVMPILGFCAQGALCRRWQSPRRRRQRLGLQLASRQDISLGVYVPVPTSRRRPITLPACREHAAVINRLAPRAQSHRASCSAFIVFSHNEMSRQAPDVLPINLKFFSFPCPLSNRAHTHTHPNATFPKVQRHPAPAPSAHSGLVDNQFSASPRL